MRSSPRFAQARLCRELLRELNPFLDGRVAVEDELDPGMGLALGEVQLRQFSMLVMNESREGMAFRA